MPFFSVFIKSTEAEVTYFKTMLNAYVVLF